MSEWITQHSLLPTSNFVMIVFTRIAAVLLDNPQQFSILSGGGVMVCDTLEEFSTVTQMCECKKNYIRQL